MSKRFFIFPALLVATFVFAGCGQTTSTNSSTTKNTNTTKTNGTTKTTNSSEAAEYAVSITSPEDGDTVASGFDLKVNVSGFTFAPDSIEKDNVEGEGHYHVWVDGEYFAQGATPSITLKDVETGEHEVIISLQNNDHTDLSPAVKSEPITVTVE